MAFTLFLMTCLVTYVFSQAPGDGDSLCVDPVIDNSTAIVPNPFFNLHLTCLANVRPLMDSRDYLSLIDEEGAVWKQVENHTSNSAWCTRSQADSVLHGMCVYSACTCSFVFLIQWDKQTGSICNQTVQVCEFDVGPQNNSLITQHISRQLSDGQLLDRVSVKVEFELNGCNASQQCPQSFDVYRWDTSDIDSAAARDIQNYMFVDRISPEDTSGTVRTNATLIVDLTSVTETGLYLALVDLSTCVIVHHLLVFYYVCPAETANLITRPETIAPESAISGQCVKNSSPTSSDQPLLSCTDMGTWNIITGCACDSGFQGVTEDGAVTSCSGIYVHKFNMCNAQQYTNNLYPLTCMECPAGTYSDSVSNSPCQSCPENSEATQTGLSKCPCIQGYYRAPDEGAGEACTHELWSPPSAPLNVSVSNVTNTSAVLSWLPPEDDGGRDRSEIHYTVTATGTGASASVEVTVNDTMTEVTGLTPFTDYTFSVTSENAVSSQANDTSSRTATTTATTPEGVAGTVTDIELTESDTVRWTPPNPPNGEILYYNVRITHSESGELERYIEVFNDTSIDVPEYVGSNGDFIVQIQAVTLVGSGNFSSPVVVTVGKNKESDNAVVIGVTVAIVAVITVLAIVAGVLIIYGRRKKVINNDPHIYDEVPDTKLPPALPPRIQQNIVYGMSSQQDLNMTVKRANDTCSGQGLNMRVNPAYDTCS